MKLKKTLSALLVISLFTGCQGAPKAAALQSKVSTVASETTDVAKAATKVADAAKDVKPITIVWYPNESAADFAPSRDKFASYVEKATGKKVINKTTTDYSIAIQTIASGKGQIAFMGGLGYIQAQQQSKDIKPLVVSSGPSGTLDDAVYYSYLSVKKGDDAQYKDASGNYSLDNVVGKKISFVSSSSTSGFGIPAAAFISHFGSQDKYKGLTNDAFLTGGPDKFFSEVAFGKSHQGSVVNLLKGTVEICANDDTDLDPYVTCESGDPHKPGATFKVKDDASEPFDTLKGKEYTTISAIPVDNGPFAYNASTLSADDVKKIQDILTSDEVTNDPVMFAPADSDGKSLFNKKDSNKFIVAADSWYDGLRKIVG